MTPQEKLRLLISLAVNKTGETPEHIERHYYKVRANSGIFLRMHEDPILHVKTARLRKISDLTPEELDQSILNFCKLVSEL